MLHALPSASYGDGVVPPTKWAGEKKGSCQESL